MNTRVITLIGIAVLATMVLLLHLVAYEYYFYWTIWWYDIVMHGLGGIVIAAFALWLWRYGLNSEKPVPSMFALTFLSTLAVGIAWEIFEYIAGSHATQPFDSYILDTILDIMMDIAGGMIAYLFLSKIP